VGTKSVAETIDVASGHWLACDHSLEHVRFDGSIRQFVGGV
jgi:hypothetical protein